MKVAGSHESINVNSLRSQSDGRPQASAHSRSRDSGTSASRGLYPTSALPHASLKSAPETWVVSALVSLNIFTGAVSRGFESELIAVCAGYSDRAVEPRFSTAAAARMSAVPPQQCFLIIRATQSVGMIVQRPFTKPVRSSSLKGRLAEGMAG